MGGPRALCDGVGLRGHDGARVCVAQATLAHETGEAQLFRRVHDHDAVEFPFETCFEKQRYVGHHNARSGGSCRREGRCTATGDFRVYDGFQVSPRRRIGKHEPTEGGAVECAVAGKHGHAESPPNASQRSRARRQGGPRQRVRVNYGGAACGQSFGHRALSARNVAGQSHMKHAFRRSGGVRERGVLRLPILPMRTTPRRPGFTIIELAITLAIAAIVAAMALPAVDFNRMRMDSNARLVQNWFLGAQSRAVQRNMQVLVEVYYEQNQVRIIDDSTADGAYTSGETQSAQTLSEGMKFVTPPSTIDGATAYYATGTGISLSGAQNHPLIKFYPNGSTSGDAVFYLGSPQGRLKDNRAIKVTGSTSKMFFYRMRPDGTWALSEM